MQHDDEAHIKAPDAAASQSSNFFDLDFNLVSKEERAETLAELARKIDIWNRSGKFMGKPAPEALVLVMPEGYGKSHLVLDLVSKGFKVVFCAKSHVQLDEKEQGFQKTYGLKTFRFRSRRQNLRAAITRLGLPTEDFKLVEKPSEDPYAQSKVLPELSVKALNEFFTAHNVDIDADVFFKEHYIDFEYSNGSSAEEKLEVDVFLISMAAMQALTLSEKSPWWKRLGVIRDVVYRTPESFEGDESDEDDEKIPVLIPARKVAVIIDDPDRSDVDWLRPVSEEVAERFRQSNQRRLNWRHAKESPKYWATGPKLANLIAKEHQDRLAKYRSEPNYKLTEYKGGTYLERPRKLSLGFGLKQKQMKPTIVLTTTEWLTGYYALQTLKRSGLRTEDHVELFHTAECIVTVICTTITRKRNHAVLLPIIEKLKDEFPNEDLIFIADGLGCKFNLSNNKGRNELAEKTSIIKLSWPHPSVSSTLSAHFSDVENLNQDLMIGTLLADLGNQAIGRNQGFRFKGKQAIVLIDPKYHKVILDRKLIRYKLTTWSSRLPNYNRKTTKKAALAALNFSSEQSPLERRLLHLIANFETFGRSPEAQEIATKLPERQRAHYEKWFASHGTPEALEAEARADEVRRVKTAEKVRRHRERKKESTSKAN